MHRSIILCAAMALAACGAAPRARAGQTPQGSQGPVFSNPLSITNRFQPFVVGAIKVFTGAKDRLRAATVDNYLSETRSFLLNGSEVSTHVLQESSFEGGRLVEISHNFFAQADDGAVYYFGEVVDIFDGGVVTGHGGSWLVGGPTDPADPAETATAKVPAVFMPAQPVLGDRFKPEDLFPLVDETDEVTGVDLHVVVPAGAYDGCIRVRETSRLDPGSETKWYAPGVGVIRARASGESSRLIASSL